ncbi:MAG TPA: molecular chaperone DnaJ [Polyangiaceae bacterium]|nr:molecular chaperone DnaJ [Polyangiaceae bacterium]
MRDPYEILGIPRSASEAEIKAAFRKLAIQHHPDRNPNDPDAAQRFKELNAAYQILSDPQKRSAYDRYGESAFRPGGAGGVATDFDFSGIEDLFGDLLGAFGFRNDERGLVRKTLEISFEEAAHGCTHQVSYERVDQCSHCSGSGGEPHSRQETCGACGGRGKVRFQQALFPIAMDRPCSRCRGTGKLPSVPCSNCQGSGLGKSTRRVEVDIPAGVEDGSMRVVSGAGNRIRPDRPAGDLEITVRVASHEFFRRVGDDVACRIPVSFSQATLGGEVEVPTLDGSARLRIPPSTQPGSVLRLRGKGIPHRVRSGRGDQLVEVTIRVPEQLSERARRLVEELGHELGETVNPQEASFMEKLKGLFS